VFVMIAAAVMARIERRKISDYGLSLRLALRKNFWLGALLGFLSISGALLAIFALHGFRITGLAIHGTTILTATLAWTGACVAIGLCEESVFRGYPLFTLTTGIGTAKLPAQVSAALNDNLAGSSTRVVDAPRFHVCPRAYIRISERCAKGI
jgi:membrane protease YdiL (CAAX protease family)